MLTCSVSNINADMTAARLNTMLHVTSAYVPHNYIDFKALSAVRLWEVGDDAELQDCHI